MKISSVKLDFHSSVTFVLIAGYIAVSTIVPLLS